MKQIGLNPPARKVPAFVTAVSTEKASRLEDFVRKFDACVTTTFSSHPFAEKTK